MGPGKARKEGENRLHPSTATDGVHRVNLREAGAASTSLNRAMCLRERSVIVFASTASVTPHNTHTSRIKREQNLGLIKTQVTIQLMVDATNLGELRWVVSYHRPTLVHEIHCKASQTSAAVQSARIRHAEAVHFINLEVKCDDGG